jgi:hypothetical protein
MLKMNTAGDIIWQDTITDLAGKYGVTDLSLGVNVILCRWLP